ncbi:MAG: hypothetical protein LBT62_04250, partial [Deltaproteobacteria bacterium]|nr:hypothetical protein [Deltaproteobacteria bacterium]
ANQKKLLETAAKLDEQLINLESRLCALEDILLDPNQPHDPNRSHDPSGTLKAFDKELNR